MNKKLIEKKKIPILKHGMNEHPGEHHRKTYLCLFNGVNMLS